MLDLSGIYTILKKRLQKEKCSEEKSIKDILNDAPELQKTLFARGFCFVNFSINEDEYPFYSIWKKKTLANGSLYVAPNQHSYTNNRNGCEITIIGHAYNPIDGLFDENEIINKMLGKDSWTEKLEYISQLTGVHTILCYENEEMYIVNDCAGMYATYYFTDDKRVLISSHAQLIADICAFPQSEYTQSLKKYRFWQLYGNFMPGAITPFKNVFRLVPNTYVTVSASNEHSVTRFYPLKNIDLVNDEQEYNAIIKKIGNILHENLKLIAKKWSIPAISMTGGMDSKLTVASANGLYDKFKYYSYISMDGDKVDADAAHIIAEAIGVKHNIFHISNNDGDFANISELRAILEHNAGHIGKTNDNDVRKRAFFLDTEEFDVEVKSWVSEIGRGNYYKKFGLKHMPHRLKPRHMSTMYKLFTYNRKQLWQTDKIFSDYIKRNKCYNIFNYDASDMYLWEFRYGSWGGGVITHEHQISYEITIPYNNRVLMELFFKLPLDKRISDTVHYDAIREMNPVIDQLGITVTNWNETRSRMLFEKIHYLINTHIPF